MHNLTDQYQIVIQAAVEASSAIMEIYEKGFEVTQKSDGSPVTNADLASAKIIRETLRSTNIPITDEESVHADYSIRKNWQQSWCVDPLDGTKEFVKRNGEFVINIALIDQAKPVFGLIASPVQQKIILGNRESGVYQLKFSNIDNPSNWQKIQPLGTVTMPVQLIGSRSRFFGDASQILGHIEENYGIIQRSTMGSALKFFELAHQRADIYLRFAPTMEWDIAAGQAIYEALGGRVVDLQTGCPMTYNKPSLFNPNFIAYNPELKLDLKTQDE